MGHTNIYLLIWIGSIFILQISARVYHHDENDEYEHMKRFWNFGKQIGQIEDSKNICQSNICGTGECISLSTTYYCRCPSDLYGEHCEKRFSKRNLSKRQSLHNFLEQLKRILNKSENRKSTDDDDDERTYYDARNGVSF